MELIGAYWAAALVAAVVVFVVSSVVHMALPYHKSDYGFAPNEDELRKSLNAAGLKPGRYMMPGCHSMKDLASEEMQAKFKEGPVGWFTILPPGPPSMGKNLLGWFVFTVFISFVVAYLADMALGPGERELVFRFTAAASFAIYGLSVFPETIWKAQPLSVSLKFVLDGLFYGLATGFAFDLMWPEAALG